MRNEEKNRVATILWTCGNPGKDGNGPSWRIPIYIHSKSRKWDIVNYVDRDFADDCKNALHIDIDNWLNAYGETSLPEKDFEILKNVGIIKPEAENKFAPMTLFKLWCAVLSYIRPDVMVEVRKMPEIRPRFGKGLFPW